MNDPEANVIPNSLLEEHSRCYANMLADKLKIADMEADNRVETDSYR